MKRLSEGQFVRSRRQVEYYFSVKNIASDEHMANEMNSFGGVRLFEIVSWRRAFLTQEEIIFAAGDYFYYSQRRGWEAKS